MGVIPPLSEQAWQETFEQYKQYPEYQKVNVGMDVDGFKRIFMYEYLHRVLGRLIGVIFFFPMLYFALRGFVAQGHDAASLGAVPARWTTGSTGLVYGEKRPGRCAAGQSVPAHRAPRPRRCHLPPICCGWRLTCCYPATLCVFRDRDRWRAGHRGWWYWFI